MIPLSTQSWIPTDLTQIDALSLLDKVLLHELTHTTAGRASEDVCTWWFELEAQD